MYFKNALLIKTAC